jgi:hypothetical protein
MLITRKSMLTGVERTLDIPCTQEQLDAWNQGQDLIQRIMPDLTADQREFIMTGCTSEEWDAASEGYKNE